MANELIRHLAKLRRDAGNPPYRALARLTEQQGPRATMARSTIADKLNGKPPLGAGHVLILVRAIADYAAECGHPLLPQEIDTELWRTRVEAAICHILPAEKQAVDEADGIRLATLHGKAEELVGAPTGIETSAIAADAWDLESLRLAGMDDIVEWITENDGNEFSVWMPRVLEALALVKMSDLQFVKAAGKRPPREACELLHALGEGHEAKRVVAAMASQYPVDDIPKAIVAMRRYPVEWIRQASSSFVESIATGVTPGIWGAVDPRQDVRDMHDALKEAKLTDDAYQLILQIAIHRSGVSLVNAVLSFPREDPWDEGSFLLSQLWDESKPYRLVSTVKVIHNADRLTRKTKSELLKIITDYISDKQQASARRALEEAGMVGVLYPPEDEPPF